MKRFNFNLSSFALGEIMDSNNLSQSKYYDSSYRIYNMMLSQSGSLLRRVGTKFMHDLGKNTIFRIISLDWHGDHIMMQIAHDKISFYINGAKLIIDNKEYSISAPWITKDVVDNLTYTYDQSGGGYIFLSAHKITQYLHYSNEYKFFFSDIHFWDGPYQERNKTDITVNVNSLNGNVILTASAPLFTTDDAVYKKGRLIRIYHSGLWGYGQISNYISSTVVKVDTKIPFISTLPTKDFRLGEWCPQNGYPEMVTFYNGRAYYCAKKKVWISTTSDYRNMSPSEIITQNNVVVDSIGHDKAISFNLAQADKIMWIASNKNNVLVGTKDGVFLIIPLKETEALSPYNYAVSKISSEKSSKIAIVTEFLTFYVDDTKKKIYALEITDNKVSFFKQINSYSEHLFKSGIQIMRYINYPSKMLLVVLETGNFLIGHLQMNNNNLVWAWCEQALSNDTHKVIDIGTYFKQDVQQIWLHTKTKIRGEEKFYIELLELRSWEYSYNSRVDLPYFLDSYALVKLIDNKITIPKHLMGKNIGVMSADNKTYIGEYFALDEVINIQFNKPNQDVIVGYNYRSVYKSQIFNKGINMHTKNGDKKIDFIKFIFSRSKNVNILDNNNNIIYRDIIDTTTNSMSEIGQEVNFNFWQYWDASPRIVLQQNSPFPMILNSLHVSILVR